MVLINGISIIQSIANKCKKTTSLRLKFNYLFSLNLGRRWLMPIYTIAWPDLPLSVPSVPVFSVYYQSTQH